MAMVQALIHGNADFTHVDVHGRSALHAAAEVSLRWGCFVRFHFFASIARMMRSFRI